MSRPTFAFFICATEHLFEAALLVAKHLSVHEASAAKGIVVCRNRPGLIGDMLLAGLPLELEHAVHIGKIPLEIITSLTDAMIRDNAYRLSRMYGEGHFVHEDGLLAKIYPASRTKGKTKLAKSIHRKARTFKEVTSSQDTSSKTT